MVKNPQSLEIRTMWFHQNDRAYLKWRTMCRNQSRRLGLECWEPRHSYSAPKRRNNIRLTPYNLHMTKDSRPHSNNWTVTKFKMFWNIITVVINDDMLDVFGPPSERWNQFGALREQNLVKFRGWATSLLDRWQHRQYVLPLWTVRIYQMMCCQITMVMSWWLQ